MPYKNQQKAKEYFKRYRETHKEYYQQLLKLYRANNKEGLKHYSKQYYIKYTIAKNLEKKRLQKFKPKYKKCESCGIDIVLYKNRKYCDKCKIEIYQKRAKDYLKSWKGKISNAKRRWKYRVKLKKIRHQFTTEEWLRKLELTKGICPICKRYVGIMNLQLDHIYPVSKAKEGQIYTIDDIQPLCKKCNARKKDIIY